MKNKDFRALLAKTLKPYNAHFGDNTGSFGNLNYKINYQILNNRLQERCRTYYIDFDIWCKNSLEVDDIADELEALLNYKSIELKGFATFLLEERVNADEKEIFRRTLSYSVETFEEV